MLRFEWAVRGHAQILCLLGRQSREFDAQFFQVQPGYLFVKLLGQHVNLVGIAAVVSIGPEFQLSQHLIGKAGAHHEAGVSGGTTQIQESAFGQNEHASTRFREAELVILGLDVRCSTSPLFSNLAKPAISISLSK